jgi:hypothetical protein
MNYKKVREIARQKSIVKSRMEKIAQSTPAGFLDTPNVEISEGTRQKKTDMPKNPEKLYDLSVNDEESSVKEPKERLAGTLSTRTSPITGMQMQRVGDNVYKDETGRIFDYNKGFKIGDTVYPPTSPSYQTDLLNLAKEFSDKGLVKEARILTMLCGKKNK